MKVKGAYEVSCSSGYLNSNYLALLEDLLDSTDVFIHNVGTNKIEPIVLTSSEMITDAKEGMIKLDISFVYSRSKKTHNG